MSFALAKKQSTDNTHKKQNNNGHSSFRSHHTVHQSLHVPIIQRKPNCPCGGSCPRCKEELSIQPKLKIGHPNDKYEREADRVAAQVMRMPDSEIEENPLRTGLPQISRIQRMCPECEEELQRQPIEENEEEMVQTKADSAQNQDVTSSIEYNIQSQKGGGRPLNKSTQEFFGSRMGADFSGVRVHTGTGADNLNRKLNAKAFTIGQDIFFRQGEYNPDTSRGKELAGHELTHVVHQSQERKIMKQGVSKELTPGTPVGGYIQSQRHVPESEVIQKPFQKDNCISKHKEDHQSFSINVARHFIRTEIDSALAGEVKSVKCTGRRNCDVTFSSDLVINVWWPSDKVNRVRAELVGSDYRCIYEYSCDAKGNLTHTLLRCFGNKP